MNEVLWHNETTDITETNRLKQAAAVVAFHNFTRELKVEERASLVKKNLRKQGSTKRILADVLNPERFRRYKGLTHYQQNWQLPG